MILTAWFSRISRSITTFAFCSVVFIVGNTNLVFCTKGRGDFTIALSIQKHLITDIKIKVSYKLINRLLKLHVFHILRFNQIISFLINIKFLDQTNPQGFKITEGNALPLL